MLSFLSILRYTSKQSITQRTPLSARATYLSARTFGTTPVTSYLFVSCMKDFTFLSTFVFSFSVFFLFALPSLCFVLSYEFNLFYLYRKRLLLSQYRLNALPVTQSHSHANTHTTRTSIFYMAHAFLRSTLPVTVHIAFRSISSFSVLYSLPNAPNNQVENIEMHTRTERQTCAGKLFRKIWKSVVHFACNNTSYQVAMRNRAGKQQGWRRETILPRNYFPNMMLYRSLVSE